MEAQITSIEAPLGVPQAFKALATLVKAKANNEPTHS